MARSRKFAVVNGREVLGVSAMPDGRFYIIDNGKRQYFKTATQARAAFAAQQNNLTDVDVARLQAVALIRHAETLERLRQDDPKGRLSSIEPYRDTGKAKFVLPMVLKHVAAQDALADEVGVPAMSIQHAATDSSGHRGPKLSAILNEWTRLKKLDGRVGPQHVRGVQRRFKRFVQVVENRPVDSLTAGDFRTWREWIMREAAKRKSGKWANDMHGVVKAVFRAVRRHNLDWSWPVGLTDWVEYERRPYKAKRTNRQPLPVTVFQSLLKTADVWAATDPTTHDSTTQTGRGKRAQALIRQRDGVQMRAALCLLVNAGLDPVDLERVQWSDLRFDDAIPHLALPRQKVLHQVGEEIERHTPLLSATTNSLTQWRKYEPVHSPFVFRSARRATLTGTLLGRTFRRLAAEAGVDPVWSSKHARNIGPSLAKAAGLSIEVRDTFLGHVVRGTHGHYEDDPGPACLLPVVNLIGHDYFGGEQVVSEPKSQRGL